MIKDVKAPNKRCSTFKDNELKFTAVRERTFPSVLGMTSERNHLKYSQYKEEPPEHAHKRYRVQNGA